MSLIFMMIVLENQLKMSRNVLESPGIWKNFLSGHHVNIRIKIVLKSILKGWFVILEDDKFTCASVHAILVVTISYLSFFFSYVLSIVAESF